MLHPYPNQNAYLLGEWYWNRGLQKSQTSFKQLVDIVGDPEFQPADVRVAKWDAINHALADHNEWTDEDAGWVKTPISINVPFQRRCDAPSRLTDNTQEYIVADFHHRSLVSIKEKLTSPTNHDFFNYDPYALMFQPAGSSNPIR